MTHLTLEQRYQIQSFSEAGFKDSQIAVKIGVHKSTICREKKRNSDLRNDSYRAELAHKKARKRIKNKPKARRFTKEVKQTVEHFIQKDYSPEQVKGYCDKIGLTCVSHERIYQYIWEDKTKGGSLYTHLRRQGRRYRKRGNAKDNRGIIPNRVGIEKRPEIVDKKERFGDLEVDLIMSKANKGGAILTINDRTSGMLKMDKIPSKEAEVVTQKINEILEDWMPFINTITADNGKEFAGHQKVSEFLNIDFYFARPYHSWERGANENLNGLIRQYFPKSSSFENITKEQIQTVQNKINSRPRKRFNFQNPIFVMDQLLFHQKLRL